MSKMGFVYFAQLLGGPVKIGWARNVDRRLKQLQRGLPYDLYLLCSVPGDLGDELRYHRVFADTLIRGEWFHPSPAIVGEVNRLRSGWPGILEHSPEAGLDLPQPTVPGSGAVGVWIASCCDIGDPDMRASAGELYEHYRKWCAASELAAMTATAFGRVLSRKGYVSWKHPKGGNRYRVGIVLRDAP